MGRACTLEGCRSKAWRIRGRPWPEWCGDPNCWRPHNEDGHAASSPCVADLTARCQPGRLLALGCRPVVVWDEVNHCGGQVGARGGLGAAQRGSDWPVCSTQGGGRGGSNREPTTLGTLAQRVNARCRNSLCLAFRAYLSAVLLLPLLCQLAPSLGQRTWPVKTLQVPGNLPDGGLMEGAYGACQ